MTQYPLKGTPKATALSGVASVEVIEGDNRMVSLRLQDLPAPEDLDPAATVYILWIVGDGDSAVKAARVAYDRQSHLARVRATTPLHRFEFFITAEANFDAPYPRDSIILRQRVP
ncbi:MAG: hypothetical protein ACPGUV_13760 [Polyangiales bacterium]